MGYPGAPELHIDKAIALRNIRAMSARAASAGVSLRPHFKTHHSRAVGEWFRASGVTSITVSSFEMASYFAEAGWTDILVAFTASPGDVEAIRRLSSRVRLGILAERPEAAVCIEGLVDSPVDLWLEIDCGSGRTGIPWNDTEAISSFVRGTSGLHRLGFRGILTHAGDSYSVRGPHEVMEVHKRTLERMAAARGATLSAGAAGCLASCGDTPTCSLADSFPGIDEIRPGNFVFYDLMQVLIGSCRIGDVAARVSCTVAAVYPDRIVVRCGAVHLSKESVVMLGKPTYGLVVRPGALPEGPGTYASLFRLSQEHGVASAPPEFAADLRPGERLEVIPVHSCLTCWQFPVYHCGKAVLPKMRYGE
ncbi:hypothetical protein GX411_03705 [Candidatus Fermentibacteria bacterium]|nr:hypothetical protein [Candidatus Fermentibacteria bacterium]